MQRSICRVVNGLRHARIGAIGARPAGFQTVRASEKLLQKSGITVVPVDLSEILGAARKIEDTDVELLKKLEEIKCYAVVPKEYSDKLVLCSVVKEHERRKSSFLYTALEKSRSVTNIQNFFLFLYHIGKESVILLS